ncbi:MAG TPA: UPF0182 family protein, partial [Acidobacteriaceae bacterium]|nr:UPF0182 family protein [Acidobacteriaceae bacterium]
MSHERVVYPIREHSERRFRGALLWIVIAILLILFSARTAVSYYVDSLWFSSLGYLAVFWRELGFEWLAFGIPSLLTFLIIFGWATALRRACRGELENAGTVVLGSRTFELPVEAALRIGSLV